MPTVLRIDGFEFYFYANENHEPMHVHVERAECVAKFWLEPVSLVWKQGFRDSEITKLTKMVRGHQALLIEAWVEFFNPEKKTDEEKR